MSNVAARFLSAGLFAIASAIMIYAQFHAPITNRWSESGIIGAFISGCFAAWLVFTANKDDPPPT
jgi:hypothetical protein